jgi:hypothetical protein
MRISIICFLTVVLFCIQYLFAISHQTYSLGSYDCMFDGIGRSYDGTAYIGAGNDLNNCALYKYDPSGNRLVSLGTVRDASSKINNWKSNDIPGKVHTSIREYNGKMYFATHYWKETAQEFLEFRGGHLYEYDPKTGNMRDMTPDTVLAPNEGIMDIAIDKVRGLIYATTYPAGNIYQHNMNTGQNKKILGQNLNAADVTRYIFADNAGYVYWIMSPLLMYYDPDADEKKSFGPIPLFPSNCMRAVLYSFTRDTIYFSARNADATYRFIPKDGKLDILMTTSINAGALRYDLNRIYFPVPEGGSGVTNNTRYLKYVNVLTGAVSNNVYSSLPERTTGCEGVDKNGDLIFATKGHSSARVVKVTLDIPCANCVAPEPVVSLRSSSDRIRKPVFGVYPNPFSTSVNIQVLMRNAECGMPNINVCVYDINGRQMARFDQFRIPHSAFGIRHTWNPTDQPAGTYIIKAQVGPYKISKTVTLIK